MKTSNVNKAVDELCLFLLCQQHTRHAILVNRTGFWSTVNSASNIEEVDTCYKCDLGLLHLGERKYAIIKNKNGCSLADTINLIREYFVKKSANAKTKLERVQKRASCTIHQNRAKRQKKEIDYLELNVGKGCAQPRGKPKPKKSDIVAALREPSEICLAAHQVQLECQHSQPGQILGMAIKSEIKSEIKQELEQRNTRHRYKGRPLSGHANYIHPDGTPCRSLMQKEAELPDLPTMEDREQNFADGLQVETHIQRTTQQPNQATMSTSRSVVPDTDISSDETGLPVETSGARQIINTGPEKAPTAQENDSAGGPLITNNTNSEPTTHMHQPENDNTIETHSALPGETVTTN